MSLCKDCTQGARHEGTVEGKEATINGVAVYIATPTVEYPKDKAILFLPDVFGYQLSNAQLLADDFARNGFYTILPDYLNGDSLPADALNPGSNFDIMKWLPNHGQEQTRPTLNKVIEGLKAQGVKEFGATGYCFGGRYVFDLAFDGVIKAAATSHPSLLQVPADLEKYAAVAKVPLLINSCTTDSQFPLEAQAKADEILGGGKFAPGYKREYFDGCTHGFAVRADLSDPTAKAAKEGAFKSTVDWFCKYL
ncbi:dienelactone hydrolase endo-1,3,1,4-beta-D-glucanase [Macrolepiota fuliginosa MF-IS2]|uniref:Dienelactone hydrolase endo-1,3,1,4-beta-D-glucanase n=1 Tax=Macrolepiota fuliginosa MF-IS2 TaxID=1400762 RepID=A0A9P6BZ30_9AGAR|nr:dienelactone hydrolase endo-1,3,1,4-beta-D-glucanase [Macrolepiota fuliginosa MF-IS2]